MKNNNRKPQQQLSKNTIKKNKLIIAEKGKDSIFFLIIAFCLPVLLYLQTVKFGFTNFDDDTIITNNISFLSNFGNAHKAFLTDAFIGKATSFYRPLQTLSYMVDIKLSGGNNTWMYHLSNIMLLGAIACLLFLLLRRFLIPPKLALLGTMIYCAHPLFVFTVAYIPTRGELLLTFFSLLSFLFLIDFLQKKKIIYLLLNWAAFTVALFCKETAVFLPVILIIYYLSFNTKKRFEIKHLLNILLYAISGIFWLWLRSKAITDISTQKDVFGLVPLLSNLRTIPESLSKFFLLFNIAPIPNFSLLKTLAGSGIIVLIIILFFNSRGTLKKEKVFCFSWFLIFMLPPMIYKHRFVDYFDHRFFLPLIGILLFLLFIFPKKWMAKGDIKRYWLLAAVFVFMLLSSFTFIKSHSYSDPMTFWNSAVSQNPNSAMAYFGRGNEKKDRKDFQGAIEDYNKATALNSYNENAYNNRGIANNSLGNFKVAIEDYNKAIAIRSNYAEAYNNKGAALGSIGNFKEAIVSFNKAIEINPNYLDAYGNRAIAKFDVNDLIGTIADCEEILRINPNDKNAIDLKIQAQQETSKNKSLIIFSVLFQLIILFISQKNLLLKVRYSIYTCVKLICLLDLIMSLNYIKCIK